MTKNLAWSENPRPSLVLNHLKDLPKSGTLSQTTDGMIYLDIADDWIFKSLEVLTTFGYKRPMWNVFVHPPAPVGSHIKVITRREAEDYELGGGHSAPDIPEIGQECEFEVVSAYPSYPRKREIVEWNGVEWSGVESQTQTEGPQCPVCLDTFSAIMRRGRLVSTVCGHTILMLLTL